MTSRVKFTMGLKSVRKPLWPSEPGYVEAMNAQIKALTDEIQSVIDQIGAVSEEIMIDALEPTFTKARDVYCPEDTGDLRNSGYLEGTGTAKAPRVEIGFAKGGQPRYAVYVHEMTGQHHKSPTQAKFLQRAVLEDLPEIFERLTRGYREFMNLGV